MKLEFEEFMKAKPIAPPADLRRQVMEQANAYLHPPLFQVIQKLTGIHFATASVSLLLCPQFGIGPLGGGMGVLSGIMGYGPVFCAMACGMFFLGLSALFSMFFLRKEEIRAIRQSGIWIFTGFALASWLILMALGGEASLVFTVVWALSGILSAWAIQLIGTALQLRTQLWLPGNTGSKGKSLK